MSVPKRHARIPGTYFVTSRTWEGRAIFIQERACRIFVDTLLYYRNEGAYQLHAFVLMPDHFHILLTPADTKSLERAVQYIKGGSARRIGQELAFRFPVWHRGFSDHRVRGAGDYLTHLLYLEQNPVRKRLAEKAVDYPWCSLRKPFPMDEPPLGLKPHEKEIKEGTTVRHG
jgi:putative transposase